MTDTQEYCCAAGVCCDLDKRLNAMTQLLLTRVHLTPADARSVATFLNDNFDLLPKAAGLRSVVAYIQAHPYR